MLFFSLFFFGFAAAADAVITLTVCTTDTHTYAHTQPHNTGTNAETDNKLTNCPAVNLAMLGFVHCIRGNDSGQSAGQKATEVRVVGSRGDVLC